jgi:hypothetical protein
VCMCAVGAAKWQVDASDAVRSLASRYYALKSVRCHNCQQEGHLSKVCPQPKVSQGHCLFKFAQSSDLPAVSIIVSLLFHTFRQV